MKIGDELNDFLKGKISSKEFAKRAVAYLDSPEWMRKKAAYESERLKEGKAGRDRLLELIKEYQQKGFDVDYEFHPLKNGHDSIVVNIGKDGYKTGTGFPSYFDTEIVEKQFLDLVKMVENKGVINL